MEFYLALKDWEEVEIARIRPICETIRISTLWLVNVQLPRKKRINRVEKLWKHIWEKEDKKPQTLQEMKSIMKVIATCTRHKKKKVNNKLK